MKNVKVKIKCDSPYGVPEYKTTGSVGMDVRFYERGEERNRNSVCAMTGFRHGVHAVFASIILPSEPATVP